MIANVLTNSRSNSPNPDMLRVRHEKMKELTAQIQSPLQRIGQETENTIDPLLLKTDVYSEDSLEEVSFIVNSVSCTESGEEVKQLCSEVRVLLDEAWEILE